LNSLENCETFFMKTRLFENEVWYFYDINFLKDVITCAYVVCDGMALTGKKKVSTIFIIVIAPRGWISAYCKPYIP